MITPSTLELDDDEDLELAQHYRLLDVEILQPFECVCSVQVWDCLVKMVYLADSMRDTDDEAGVLVEEREGFVFLLDRVGHHRYWTCWWRRAELLQV